MSDKHRILQRLFIPHAIKIGEDIHLDEEQSHYIHHVLRMDGGDHIILFNGVDGEWLGSIAAVTKKQTTITAKEELRKQETPPPIHLYCAIIKRTHFDYMIEKATEIGITHIHPIITQHCQVREVNTKRLTAIAIESSEQSRRLSVPQIFDPIPLPRLITSWPETLCPILCAETGEAMPVARALAPAITKSPAIITGPEGGFTEQEIHELRALPHALAIRLGARILRADTAVISALACWQALQGDWR